jgi:hypothetical protein
MSARELQQACRDRGLPTARDKDTMVARLEEADTAQGSSGSEQSPDTGTVITVPASSQTMPGLTVWQEQFPAREGGLTDTEHQANCAAVVAAAEARGYQTLGGGHRTGTVDDHHVYEVYLRRGGQQ